MPKLLSIDSKIRSGWCSEAMSTLRVRLEVKFLTRLSNNRNFSLPPHEQRPFVVYGIRLCIRINLTAQWRNVGYAGVLVAHLAPLEAVLLNFSFKFKSRQNSEIDGKNQKNVHF